MTDDPQAAGPPALAKAGRPERPAGPLLKEYGSPAECTRKPSAEVALVHFYRNGGHSVVTAMGTEHVDRPRFARPVTICEVARGTHLCQLSLQIPAVGSATFFEVEVDVHWSVVDYRKVVDGQVRNVAERLKGPLLERLRAICSGYPVTAAAEVDRAANSACRTGQWNDLGYDLGLHADVYVRVAVDSTTIRHADADRNSAYEDRTTARDYDREVAAEHHRTGLLQIRMRTFRAMLDGGEWNQICFMLSDNPDQARAFMELLRQESRADKHELLEHTLRLVEKGVIQSAELEAQVRELLGTPAYRIEGSFGRPPIREPAARPELPGSGHGGRDDRRDGGPAFTPMWVQAEPAPRDRIPAQAPPARRPSEAFDDWGRTGSDTAPQDHAASEDDRRRDRHDDHDDDRDRRPWSPGDRS
ncbi:hypothetical protein DR950_34325 [Kitasatospora xanthocidica]|uniref:PE-PGRS family protein n=1 Tax=Kitasatospora xanthocidica TaxID=83382 RepID=A0A373A313_9ACTN|nr:MULTISPECIES: hypothetical protein [Streptomycetaceae]RGD62154.1 hypothetical protein DR950_34325 [Kitasatospora xanthocidica]